MMRRRELITLLGGAAAWPIAAHGQQAAKVPTIALLGAGSQSQQNQWTAAFLRRLRELGWVEGRTISITYRWADGSSERAAEIAFELVRLGVDVLVTSGTPIILAAKQATTVVPIVFATAADPLGGGVVTSLSRPGGNVTGLSLQSTDLTGKRLELLREMVPSLHRLGIMANVGNPAAKLELGEAQTAGQTLGLDIATYEIRRRDDIVPAFRSLKSRIQALYVVPDPLAAINRVRINTLALSPQCTVSGTTSKLAV